MMGASHFCVQTVLAKCITHGKTMQDVLRFFIHVMTFLSVYRFSLQGLDDDEHDVAMNDIREIMEDGRRKGGKEFVIGDGRR